MNVTNAYSESRWLPPGEVITIAGRQISSGFVYVGSGGMEPSIIDPTLPVSPVGELLRERGSNGNSYVTFSAAQRGAYLDWLARGRTGKLFTQALLLFLMGVERRWLGDRTAAREELLALSDECRRLADAYVEEELFVHYAASLSDAIRLWTDRTPPSELPVDFSKMSNLRTYVGLKEFAADRRRLPYEWALLLGAGHPHGRAIRRLVVHEEFRELFAIRYAREFGDGILLAAGWPTSHELSVCNPTLQAPFVTFVMRPQAHVDHAGAEAAMVVELGKRVELELNAYLRCKRSSGPINVGLLPEDLIERFGGEETKLLIDRIEATLATAALAQLSWADILKHWRSPELQYGIPHRLANVLARRGIGFEPHPAYPPSSWLSPSERVIVFRESNVGEISRSLKGAAAVIDVVAPVMRTSKIAAWPIVEHVAAIAGLQHAESVRLRARALWHLVHNFEAGYERLRTFADLPLTDWLRDAWLMALSDEKALAELVREDVYLRHQPILARLGIDLPPRFFGKGVRARAPKPVLETGAAPSPAPSPAPSLCLDETVVAATLEESRRGTAFVESLNPDSDDAPAPPPVGTGLSDEELSLLRELIATGPMSRRDLDALCRTRNRFTLAFMERINDLAIAVTGEAAVLIDGDVELDLPTLKTILKMESTT